MKSFADSLLISGEDTAGSSAGVQLHNAMQEYCCLHHIKALVDPRGHKTIFVTPDQKLGNDSNISNNAASCAVEPDWGAIGVRPCSLHSAKARLCWLKALSFAL